MSVAASIPEEWGPPEKYRINRAGDRDLAFTGWLIGKATQPVSGSSIVSDEGQSVDFGVDVCIYVTEAERIVTHSYRWTEFAARAEGDDLFVDGFTGPHHREGDHNADWHDQVDSALDWLRDDAGGRLGAASKEAWTEACRRWPELTPHEVEDVDAMPVAGPIGSVSS